ncbi:hypothetical protein HNR00_005039 [Methylorubrum rhodinum]|uniref:Uncharacterized protein n=1 Tax=Methylorubrum rhodinum TaxID=29428 RepID=A0A840ZSH3_9HYPH|nr:hypothetical protein [Methylorubrum rhodinum]MBB5760290.1 hypothetical protein [Methylorubrum rhodinum]
MEQLYRGVETSLLVLSLALVLGAATLPTFQRHGALEVTLPMISVAPDDAP